MTERAHAVSPVAKVSSATRNFIAAAKSRPLGEGGIAVGDDGRGALFQKSNESAETNRNMFQDVTYCDRKIEQILNMFQKRTQQAKK